jgi:hypothetical protein
MPYFNFPPIEALRETLNECGLTALEIYDKGKFGPPWQQAFRHGRAKAPSYTKCCALAEFLHRECPDLLAEKIEKHAAKHDQAAG